MAALLALGVLLGGGCNEISARRQVQDGNKQYENGRYEEAAARYEAALAKSPDLVIAHHNLGVTYYKLMKRGDDSPGNQALANKATEHLLVYLEAAPKEGDVIRRLVTEIWVDSGQVDRALAFWEAEHAKHPQDRSILSQLADLEYKKGDWRKAVGWLEKSVAVAPDDTARAASYLSIGRLCFLKMFNNKDTIVGLERIEMADLGVAALQKGLQLQPKNGEIVSTLASLNQQRALAHGSRIGFHLDLAGHQNYMRILDVLRQEAKQNAPAAPDQPAPAPGDQGT